MEPRNINLTDDLIEASKRDYKKNTVNLSQRTRELLRKFYKKEGLL